MRNTCAAMIALTLLGIGSAGLKAAPVNLYYRAVIDTSSVAGTEGNLDFQFVPGVPNPLPAVFSILHFDGSTLAGNPAVSGPVSGTLLNDLSIPNTAASDYYQPVLFGSSLTFRVGIAENLGPLTGGNMFAFSILDNAASPNPLLTNDQLNGYAFTVNYPSNVFPNANNASYQTTLFFSTPEPASWILLTVGLGVVSGWRRYQVARRFQTQE